MANFLKIAACCAISIAAVFLVSQVIGCIYDERILHRGMPPGYTLLAKSEELWTWKGPTIAGPDYDDKYQAIRDAWLTYERSREIENRRKKREEQEKEPWKEIDLRN